MEKSEILAETKISAETASFGRNTLFWQTFWSDICCQDSLFLAKEAVLAETETYFGRNRTVTVCPLHTYPHAYPHEVMLLGREPPAGLRHGQDDARVPGRLKAIV